MIAALHRGEKRLVFADSKWGLRSDGIGRVAADRLVISGTDGDVRWWTWGGCRVNVTLQASLSQVADPSARVNDRSLEGRLVLPLVDDRALEGLKFSMRCPATSRRRP